MQLFSFFYNRRKGGPKCPLVKEKYGRRWLPTSARAYTYEGFSMASDVMEIIGVLKNDAVERCRRRIRQAAEKRDGCVKRANSGESEYGITSAFKRRHGL